MENIRKIKEELLDEYQVRKSKKQKADFINYVENKCSSMGYTASVEKERGLISSRNIVIGDIESANVVFTAHYDTCAWSPFPNMIWIKNTFMYCLYQLFICMFTLGIGFASSVIFAFITKTADYTLLVFEITILFILLQMMFGIRNKHTANDNTSGVLTLFAIMEKMKEEDRDKVAFVFFDNEEKGLLGSKAFRRKHSTHNKLILNLDCVGEGTEVFFVYNKSTEKRFIQILENCLPNDDQYSDHIIKGGLLTFPSDQLHFRNGVGIATTKKFKLGGYVVGRLHTGRDKMLDNENIEYLSTLACILAKQID